MTEEKYKLQWEKFLFPDEVDENIEEDEDENPQYNDVENPTNILSKILTGPQNPFVQLKTYNFWTLHTNFYLTPALIMYTSTVPGVESIDIVSPYRVYISIGRAFDEVDVKFAIRDKLLGMLNEQTKS